MKKPYKSRYIMLDMDHNICVKQIKKYWWSTWKLQTYKDREDNSIDLVRTWIKDEVAKYICFENLGFEYNKK